MKSFLGTPSPTVARRKSVGGSSVGKPRPTAKAKAKGKGLGLGKARDRFAIVDPDPMMQALYGNILSLEAVLETLNRNVINFARGTNFFCLNMTTLATNIAGFCAEDAAIAADTSVYATRVASVSGAAEQSRRAALLAQMELKVLEPLNVNLTVLRDIKERMVEREALRAGADKARVRGRASSFTKRRGSGAAAAGGGGGGISGDGIGGEAEAASSEAQAFDRMTRELFEELTALHQHRFDFIRAPFQALKRCQFNFFAGMTEALGEVQGTTPRPATSEEPKRVPPAKESKSALEVRSEGAVDSEHFKQMQAQGRRSSFRGGINMNIAKRLRQRRDSKGGAGAGGGAGADGKAEEVVVAVPLKVGFNADDDRPSAGTAYLRLGKARGEDAVGSKPDKPVDAFGDDDDQGSSKFHGAADMGPIKINLGRKSSSSTFSSASRRAPPSDDGAIVMQVAPASDDAAAAELNIPTKAKVKAKAKAEPEPAGDHIVMKMAPPDHHHIVMKMPPPADAGAGARASSSASTGGDIVMKIAPAPAPRQNEKRPKKKSKKAKKSKKDRRLESKKTLAVEEQETVETDQVGLNGAGSAEGEDEAKPKDDAEMSVEGDVKPKDDDKPKNENAELGDGGVELGDDDVDLEFSAFEAALPPAPVEDPPNEAHTPPDASTGDEQAPNNTTEDADVKETEEEGDEGEKADEADEGDEGDEAHVNPEVVPSVNTVINSPKAGGKEPPGQVQQTGNSVD